MRPPLPLIFLLALVATGYSTPPVRFWGVRVQIDRKTGVIGQPVVVTYQVVTDKAKHPEWGATDGFFRGSRSLLFLMSSTKAITPSLTQHSVLFTALSPFTGAVGPVPVLVRGPSGTDTLHAPAVRLTFVPERPVAALHPIRTAASSRAYVDLSPGQLVVGALLVLAMGGAAVWKLTNPGPRPTVAEAGARQAALSKLAGLERALRAEDCADANFADHLFRILTDYLEAERRPPAPLRHLAQEPVAPVGNHGNAERAAAVLGRLEQMRFSRTAKRSGEQARLLQEVQEAIGPLNYPGATQPLVP